MIVGSVKTFMITNPYRKFNDELGVQKSGREKRRERRKKKNKL
jgi:hypothetical protein